MFMSYLILISFAIIYPWIAVLTVNIDILYLFLRREDSASTACSVWFCFIIALLFKLLCFE